MKIGFTGTRNPITAAQQTAIRELLYCNQGNHWEFHHGACKGADSYAAIEAYALNYHTVAHPGKSANGGDNEWLCPIALEHSCEVRETKQHFARNRDIVNESQMLIACPQHREPITKATRGGTAYTICYARDHGKPIFIVWPNGEIVKEGPPIPSTHPTA